MGGGQSSLYLYLGVRNGKFSLDNEYEVTVEKRYSNVCNNFERIVYNINYFRKETPEMVKYYRYYNVCIYTGTSYSYLGNYIFGYYCNSSDKIIKRILVYYSILIPNKALVVTFITKGKKGYRCRFDVLKKASWDYSSNINKYTFKHGLGKELSDQFNALSGGKKVKFCTDQGKNKDIVKRDETIGSAKKFKKMVYVPLYLSAIVHNEDFFSFIPKSSQPQIDKYYLTEVSGNKFDGIIVYYVSSSGSSTGYVLFIEFINGCDRLQFVRKDKDGYWWKKQTIKFNSEKKLEETLDRLENESDSNDVTTYILEKKDNYNNINIDSKDKQTHERYSKYKHKPPEKSKNTNLLLKNTQLNLDSTLIRNPLVDLNTYFLKIKDKNEDHVPFLIFFIEKSSILSHSTTSVKIFYCNFDNNTEWVEFKYMQDDLFKKLEQIDEIKEELDLINFRKKAYEILSGPPPPPPPKPKPEVPPRKKEEFEVIHFTGSQITGIVFGTIIGTSVVTFGGYGLYWYYTTIWLLT